MDHHEHCHHHDHEHDEHCHDHDHDEHCHHHDHDHGEGCSCGHHHDHDHELGEQIIHGSYTFSHEGTLEGGAVTLDDAMDRVEKVLLDAAAAIEVEGIIPGHLKALIQGKDTHAVLSVTRPGHCDRTCPKPAGEPEVWALTVNLISAVQPEHEPEELVLPLFA